MIAYPHRRIDSSNSRAARKPWLPNVMGGPENSTRPLLCLLVAFSMSLTLGCGNHEEATQQVASVDPDLTAIEILQNVRDTYRSADSYSDRGQFVLRYQLEGQQRQEKHPYELAFRRANELHLRLFNASLVSDGDKVAFAVNDPSTNHMDQQVVVRAAPRPMSLVPINDDSIAAFFIAGGAEIPLDKKVTSPQIELAHPALALLVGSTEPTWFGAAKDAERIKDRKLEDRDYYRIRIASPLGDYIVWVDPSRWLIRRLEFPIELLDPELSQSPLVANLQMFADLQEASTSEVFAADAFAIRLPRDARQVSQFVSLPEPFPSELVGKAPQSFELSLLGGKRLTSQELLGKTTALLWFSSESVCRSSVEEFGRVRAQLKDSANIQLIAVGTDPPASLSDVELMQLVRDWGCQEVVGRADQTVGRGIFDVRALPTLVVINDSGIVQFYRTIENGQLATELVTVIRRLNNGDNIAAEMRADYRKYLDQYHEQIAQAGIHGSTNQRTGPQDTPDPELSKVSTAFVPQGMEFIPLWRRDGFTSAGNILADQNLDRSSFFVMDGFRTVVHLDANGEEVRRTPLNLPEGVAITWLKPVPGGSQTRYIAGSVLAQQLFGLDQDWRLTSSFPNQMTAAHAGIRDVAIHANRSNGAGMTLAYWQELGVATLDAAGNQIQTNRELSQVNSIVEAATGNDEVRYYVAANDGLIRVLDEGLHIDSTQAIDNLTVTHLFGWQSSNRPPTQHASIIALAPQDATTTLALGLDASLKTIWQEPLSAAQFSSEIQFVVSGEVDGVGNVPVSQRQCWAIARPDGTVHLIAADGSWAKKLALGFSPTGIALARIKGQTVLLAANARTVQCWQIRLAAELSRREP